MSNIQEHDTCPVFTAFTRNGPLFVLMLVDHDFNLVLSFLTYLKVQVDLVRAVPKSI